LAKKVTKGKDFEKSVAKGLAESGNTDIAEQVTIEAENRIKTRIDFLSKEADGNTVLTEAKSSATAPSRPNQKSAFPSFGQSGGKVVDKAKAGYEGGTKTPPTRVR
jgi:hypothetical protein